MTTRDLTTKFQEFRASERAFAQLERWTEENIVDGLLSPSYEREDMELGFDSSFPVNVSLPQWVHCVKEFDAHCDAVECELLRLSALQRQRLLVTFNMSQEEAVEQDLRDTMTTVHESLHAVEVLLSAPYGVFGANCSSATYESDAARSSRLNARKSLAKRLLELSRKYRMLQRDFDACLAHQHTFGKKSPQKNKDAKQASSMLKRPWKMSNELSFLTESTERRVLEHLDTRCPGENIMTLEQMAQLEEHEALVAARNDDVEAVAKSITDVAQIFKELAVLVIDQGTVLDRIDYNMENVAERTQAATRQLVKASNFHADTKPLKCAIALCFTITLLLLFLVDKKKENSS
jgi:syntaxin 16